MQEIDEKLESVYDKLDKERERITSEIDKSEARSKTYAIERFERLQELIERGNTARSEQVNIEIKRLQECSNECAARCFAHKKTIDTRIKDLEDWKTMNWQRLIIYCSVAITAAVKVFEWLSTLVK